MYMSSDPSHIPLKRFWRKCEDIYSIPEQVVQGYSTVQLTVAVVDKFSEWDVSDGAAEGAAEQKEQQLVERRQELVLRSPSSQEHPPSSEAKSEINLVKILFKSVQSYY